MARWDTESNSWVQLNAAGLSKIKINNAPGTTAPGNVLSGATTTVENGAKVLTFNTINVATSTELDGMNTRVTSLEGRMDDVEDRLDVIEGSGEGSIAKAVADAKADLQGKIDAVDALADQGIADAKAAKEYAEGV